MCVKHFQSDSSSVHAYLFPEPAPKPAQLPYNLCNLLVKAGLRRFRRWGRRPRDIVCVEKVHWSSACVIR